MGEVHADNVETGSAELVDGLDRVRLWPDCADDRGPTVVLCWLELCVQGREPLDLCRAGREMIHCGSHDEGRKEH